MRSLLRNLLCTGALLVVGAASIFAQPGGRMVCSQEPGPCAGITSVVSGGILPPGGPFTLVTQGPSTFDCITPSPWPGCCCEVLAPNNWCGTGIHPIFGPVTWCFVIPNTCQLSTIKPLSPPACFPAQADLYFMVEGTLGALPGTFRSRFCIHVSAIVNSCNPFRCETFRLVNGPIPFDDVNSGAFAFNLDNLTVVLDN